MQKPALTQVAIDATIAQRWSGRAYHPDIPITHEQTLALLEAARWAPSCMGEQPWRFLVWDKFIDPQGWQSAFDCLSEGNKIWVKHAPWLCLLCADGLFSKNAQPNRWAQYDTGAAALNLCLQASSMGLVAHQLGGFDAEKARQQFAIPEQFDLMAMISVGHRGALEDLSPELQARETGARARKALGEIAYSSRWQNPLV